MDKEEYLDDLSQRNGYCDCLGLQELFNLRKKAWELENTPNFGVGVRKYYAKLTHVVNSEGLDLFSHSLENMTMGKIHIDDVQQDMMITIHCKDCNQQIDILAA